MKVHAEVVAHLRDEVRSVSGGDVMTKQKNCDYRLCHVVI